MWFAWDRIIALLLAVALIFGLGAYAVAEYGVCAAVISDQHASAYVTLQSSVCRDPAVACATPHHSPPMCAAARRDLARRAQSECTAAAAFAVINAAFTHLRAPLLFALALLVLYLGAQYVARRFGWDTPLPMTTTTKLQ